MEAKARKDGYAQQSETRNVKGNVCREHGYGMGWKRTEGSSGT